MPKILFAVTFLFISLFSWAQDDYVHYKHIVDSTNDKQLKLAALDSILGITWKNRNFNDFIDYTFTYVELAENMGEYEQLAKKAMNASHPIATFKNDPQLAVELTNMAIKYESKLNESHIKGGLYLRRGRAHVRFDNQKAIDDFDTALELFGDDDDAYKADAHLFRGQAYSNKGLFVEASDDYKKAYDYYEKANVYEYMLHARSGEIIMYSKNGFIEKAIEQREELIRDIKKLNLYQYLSIHLYNQSIDYKKMNNDYQRYQLLNEALTFADSSNNPTFNYTAIYSSLSEHYSLKNNIENAKSYLAKAEEYLPQIPNDRYANSIYLMAAIQYHINTNNWNLAKEKAIERLQILETLGLDEETISTHQTLSEIYLKLGDKERAYTHLNLHTTLKDSIFNQSKTNALIYYQTLYETERKEKQLSENLSNIALLEEKNTSLRRQYVFGGITVTLGFILLFLFKNQMNLKHKKVMSQKYTHDLLMAQEDERKRVSKDLHDGIGQSLLLIKNKVVLNKDDATKNLVENAIEEVRSISRALHPFQLQELGITKAIQNIIYQIDESTELFITSEIDNIDGLLSLQQEVNIYRIFQESFNNILKHSQATGVKVEIKKLQKQINLTIKDNGKGFDFLEKYSDFSSIGLKTIKERCRLLKGTIKVDSQPGKGTSLEFIIPF